MENKKNMFELLFEKIQAYGKTTFELYKLKAIEKISNALATFISSTISILFFLLFIIMASIGAALWLGEIFGKTYYGFLCVAGFYGVVGIVLHFILKNQLKKSISNSIITQVLN
jgi:polyferredoxin